ncbi:acyltransferase [Bdellovibrio sp.]|uniref:acyltransferase n=1 Tax=Bdellovibrio sp. TaxID=28201 RepID=UPI0039E6FB44
MKKMDLETTQTEHKGLKGLFEKTLRRFKVATHLLTMLPVYGLACLILGASLIPGISLFRFLSDLVATQSSVIQNITYGIGIATGFFLYGTTLIFLAPLVNALFRAKLKPWRGPYHSAESLKWFIHNGLTYLARFTFLEFVTPSPLSLLFYRMMGMKIGDGTVINSTWISDPSLIELGNKVTIGGSVTIVAHYGQGGLLVIAPVKIEDGCTIGIKATIMGGATIGAGAKVLPHSVVLPKTVIPAGETWGGVPAQKIDSLRAHTGKSA